MFPMLRKIWPYLHAYRWQVVWALAQVFLIAGFELLKPWPLQIVIDYVLGGKKPPAGSPIAALLSPAPRGEPAAPCLLRHCDRHNMGSAGLTCENSHYYTTICVGQNMVNDLRGALYAHLQRQSLAYHGRQRVGDLMYRITADSFAVQTMIMNGILPDPFGADPAGRHARRAVSDGCAADAAGADRGADPFCADIELQQEDRQHLDRGARTRKPGLFARPVDDERDQDRPGLYQRGRRASPLHGREP